MKIIFLSMPLVCTCHGQITFQWENNHKQIWYAFIFQKYFLGILCGSYKPSASYHVKLWSQDKEPLVSYTTRQHTKDASLRNQRNNAVQIVWKAGLEVFTQDFNVGPAVVRKVLHEKDVHVNLKPDTLELEELWTLFQ